MFVSATVRTRAAVTIPAYVVFAAFATHAQFVPLAGGVALTAVKRIDFQVLVGQADPVARAALFGVLRAVGDAGSRAAQVLVAGTVEVARPAMVGVAFQIHAVAVTFRQLGPALAGARDAHLVVGTPVFTGAAMRRIRRDVPASAPAQNQRVRT